MKFATMVAYVSGAVLLTGALMSGSSFFVGQSFTLHTAIVRGSGRVQVGDALWTVTGPDLPVGARVRVIGADAMTLKVSPDP